MSLKRRKLSTFFFFCLFGLFPFVVLWMNDWYLAISFGVENLEFLSPKPPFCCHFAAKLKHSACSSILISLRQKSVMSSTTYTVQFGLVYLSYFQSFITLRLVLSGHRRIFENSRILDRRHPAREPGRAGPSFSRRYFSLRQKSVT